MEISIFSHPCKSGRDYDWAVSIRVGYCFYLQSVLDSPSADFFIQKVVLDGLLYSLNESLMLKL
jgi:hypothetical protein